MKVNFIHHLSLPLDYSLQIQDIDRMPGYNVEEEIELLLGHIKRLGRQEQDSFQVTFKVRPEC